MSDHFLNKLKNIRQRYGLQKTQTKQIKIHQRPLPKQTVNRNHHSIQKDFIKQRQPAIPSYLSKKLQNPKQMQRSQSQNKRSLLLTSQLQNNLEQKQLSYLFHKKSFDRVFREKDYNKPSQTYKCNQPQCQPQQQQQQQLSRTYSQQKTQQRQLNNKYDLIYNYDQNLNINSTKNQFTSQSLQREPLRIRNRDIKVDDLNFNYDTLPLQKHTGGYQSIQNKQQSYSYCNNKTQYKPDWTIDKLCKVQQKIQAYLRR